MSEKDEKKPRRRSIDVLVTSLILGATVASVYGIRHHIKDRERGAKDAS